jgi:hypothetical protein
MSNLGETLTGVSKRLRVEGYTSKNFNPPRRPRASMRPMTDVEAKTSVMVAILMENNPQSMLTENEQNLILQNWYRCSAGPTKEETTTPYILEEVHSPTCPSTVCSKLNTWDRGQQLMLGTSLSLSRQFSA